MVRIARLHQLVEDHGQAVIADGQPLTVEALHGAEKRLLVVPSHPGHEGLLLGTPGRQGTDLHGHQRLTTVSVGENPLPAAGTIVVRAADASAMTGEGVGHA
jgi:hypothetical protein